MIWLDGARWFQFFYGVQKNETMKSDVKHIRYDGKG